MAAPAQPQQAHRPLTPAAPPTAGPISAAPASPALAPSGRATVPGPANPAAPRSGNPTPPHRPASPVVSSPAARGGYPNVPANRPQVPAGYGYASVPSAAEPSSGGRRLLVVLAVILGVLVLICAGTISYMLSQRNSGQGNGGTGMAPVGKVTTALHLPVGGTEAANAPYRLGERILHIGMTSEGMLTR